MESDWYRVEFDKTLLQERSGKRSVAYRFQPIPDAHGLDNWQSLFGPCDHVVLVFGADVDLQKHYCVRPQRWRFSAHESAECPMALPGYPIGYFHIDSAEVRTEEDTLKQAQGLH